MAALRLDVVVFLYSRLEILSPQIQSTPAQGSAFWLRPSGRAMNMRVRSVAELWRLTGGLIVWAAHFAFIYAVQTLYCTIEPGWLSVTQLRLTGLAASMIALVALWKLADFRPSVGSLVAPEEGRSLLEIAAGISAFGMLGVVWNAIPMLMLAPCGAG